MTVQTYCVRSDVEAIIGPVSIEAAIDIDQDGVESAYDGSLVDLHITRAANKINAQVRHQYKLSDLVNNEYLKEVNAVYAAYSLRTLGGNTAEESLEDQYNEYKTHLIEVRYGRDQLPQTVPSFDHLPTVSSLQPELNNVNSPIVVNPQQSTGSQPVGNRRRISSARPGYYW